MNTIVEEIATNHQRLDGLIAAAGIQQETPALEYTSKDSDTMMSVNVTGCFMTAQAAAKQMVRFGNGGSIVMIASMSGSIANRVHSPPLSSPQKLPLFNSLVTLPRNGDNMAFELTPYPLAISLRLWSKPCLKNSQSGEWSGQSRICWAD